VVLEALVLAVLVALVPLVLRQTVLEAAVPDI
jgi:hypothetical protein